MRPQIWRRLKKTSRQLWHKPWQLPSKKRVRGGTIRQMRILRHLQPKGTMIGRKIDALLGRQGDAGREVDLEDGRLVLHALGDAEVDQELIGALLSQPIGVQCREVVEEGEAVAGRRESSSRQDGTENHPHCRRLVANPLWCPQPLKRKRRMLSRGRRKKRN